MNMLDEIIAHKKLEVRERKRQKSLHALLRDVHPRELSALDIWFPTGRVHIIGELKKKSPYAGVFLEGYAPSSLARLYGEYCSALSVLTDAKYFGGDVRDLQAVRRATHLPLLRKDFIIDEYQIFESRMYGADMVLLIASVLKQRELCSYIARTEELGMHALVEVHDMCDMRCVLESNTRLIGINNRGLSTGEIDFGVTRRLSQLIPAEKYVISESGIEARADIELLKESVDGFLIGASILKAEDVTQKLKELTGRLYCVT